MKKSKELEIYIHIPFCVKKCLYCDFLSAPAEEEIKKAYMQALKKELIEKALCYQDYEVTTVFIGGGTPTAVKAKELVDVLQALRKNYFVRKDAEITLEMNPGTVDAEALKIYKTAGINRLSIGLQSTQEEELKTLGRIHSYEQFLQTYEEARKTGFSNINVDIMSALPNQTFVSYRQTLERVVSLNPPPEHISAYSLIVEEETPFFEAYESGRLVLPDEDTERKMYEFTGEFLADKGYKRYEISNYAKPGRECQHNLGYWERKDYVGFGIGAASMVENVRFQNTRSLCKYLQNPSCVEENRQVLDLSEQIEETMFLGLRKTAGVSWREFKQKFNKDLLQVYRAVVERHLRDGLLDIQGEGEERRLVLTSKGMDVCNYVMADFLEPDI